MTVSKIEAAIFHRPRSRVVANAARIYSSDTIVLIRVITNRGDSGIGCSRINPAEVKTCQAVIDSLARLIKPENDCSIEWLEEQVENYTKHFARLGLKIASAVNVATWDLRAKLLDAPLFQLLGNTGKDLKTYAVCGYYEYGKRLEDLTAELCGILQIGVDAIKIKIGGLSLEEDLVRVKRAREAIGKSIRLMVDANGIYSLQEAKRCAEMLDRYNVFWFEEPTNPFNLEAGIELCASTNIRVASGETLYRKEDFYRLIESGAAEIIQPDATHIGGFSNLLLISGASDRLALTVSPHGSHLLHSHLVSATGQPSLLEFFPPDLDPFSWLFEDTNLVLCDGVACVKNEPGLGLKLNRDAERFRVA